MTVTFEGFGGTCRSHEPQVHRVRETDGDHGQPPSGDDRPARRLAQRPRHQRRRGADLPDHQLPVRRHRPRRPPVRAAGAGQHLHPHHEPHHGRAGEARGGARGRRRRRGGRVRPGSNRARGAEPGRAGDNIVASRPRCTAAPTTCSPTPSRTWGSRSASWTRPTPRPSAARPTPRPAPITRDAAEPEARGVPHRRGGRHRPALRRPADHGQHRGAAACPAVRPRGGGGDALHHQVSSAATAPASAASSSTAATSTGPPTRTRQPAMHRPDPSYHGAVWVEAAKPLGPVAYA